VAAVRAAFPALDLAILFAALALTQGPSAPPRALGQWLVAAGGGCLALTDTLYAYLTLQGSFAGVGVLDVGWAGGFALLGLGALSLRRCAARAQEELLPASSSELPQPQAWSVWATLRIVLPVLATVGAAFVMIWFDYRAAHTLSFD